MRDEVQSVLVRADANHKMGIGHAMRCLAVAETLHARGYRVYFAMREIPDKLAPRLTAASVEIIRLEDVQDTPEACCTLAQTLGAPFLVVDGYHLTDAYEQAARKAAIRTLRFDDYMPGPRCHADTVVNASPHAQETAYRQWAPDAALLLGPRYIAFRSDMTGGYRRRQEREASQPHTASTSILVNFGGSDPLDMTIDTVQAIAKAIPDAPIEAVTGAAYPDPERLLALGVENFRHHHNTDNLAEIMQRARLAISAGGLTVQELALFRIPTILAITAENQIKGAHVSWCHTLRLDTAHIGRNASAMIREIVEEATMLWHSTAEREKILARIPAALDIHGADRIVDCLIGETKP
jgi:UDP-2,4-diacetamido-2,4,6-trideoxy-beta-L-altropyranose hydrolase